MSGKRVCGPLQLLCEKFVEAAPHGAMLGEDGLSNSEDCKESGPEQGHRDSLC